MSNRPRSDMKEWDECEASAGECRLAYALWLQLWHLDEDGAFGQMLSESRKPGYDGEVFVRPA